MKIINLFAIMLLLFSCGDNSPRQKSEDTQKNTSSSKKSGTQKSQDIPKKTSSHKKSAAQRLLEIHEELEEAMPTDPEQKEELSKHALEQIARQTEVCSNDELNIIIKNAECYLKQYRKKLPEEELRKAFKKNCKPLGGKDSFVNKLSKECQETFGPTSKSE